MLALDRGGCCEGVVYRLPHNGHHDQLRRLLARELGYHEHVPATRWIRVRTSAGTVMALVFYAGPFGGDYAGKRTPEEVARTLACAAGHMGSCAMYLYQTVRKLEEHGIHDRRLWRLQELVALNIAAMADQGRFR
jgi:cation transport protein ChaC